jgi:hypothetical protein
MAGQARAILTIIIWGNHLDRELRRRASVPTWILSLGPEREDNLELD